MHQLVPIFGMIVLSFGYVDRFFNFFPRVSLDVMLVGRNLSLGEPDSFVNRGLSQPILALIGDA